MMAWLNKLRETALGRAVLPLCPIGVGLCLAWFMLVSFAPADPQAVSATSDDWIISVVGEEEDGFSNDTSIALSASGKMHLSYVLDTKLYYALIGPVSLVTQTVTTTTPIARHSLALDSQGNPHIAYLADNLQYATWNGASWVSEMVDGHSIIGGGSGCAISLAIDGNDIPHISYHAENLLNYATVDQGSWVTETIESEIFGYHCGVLDVEDSGTPHIAYYDIGSEGISGVLKYATLQASNWHTETIAQTEGISPEFGLPRSLKLDSEQVPHILFVGGLNQNHRYAVLDGSEWVSETVPNSIPNFTTMYGSMDLDNFDVPHIAVRGRHITQLEGEWTYEDIDTSIGAGRNNSIAALDAQHVAIADFDNVKREIRVARNWDGALKIYLALLFR